MGLVAAGVGDDGSAELPEQLGDGDGDELEDAGAAVEGALAGGGDGEEGVGEQADRGPAVPGCPGGDLAAVQPADLLRLLVIFRFSIWRRRRRSASRAGRGPGSSTGSS